MTDVQVYLTLGVPGLMVLISALINAGYFVALGGRISSAEARVQSVENRMQGVETRMQALENRTYSFETKLDTRLDLLMGKLFEIDNRLTRVEEQLKR